MPRVITFKVHLELNEMDPPKKQDVLVGGASTAYTIGQARPTNKHTDLFHTI